MKCLTLVSDNSNSGEIYFCFEIFSTEIENSHETPISTQEQIHMPQNTFDTTQHIRIQRMSTTALFTLFVKIKSHRGDFFNKMADRRADEGRDTEMEAKWTSLRQRPIFTWTASGIAHRSTMSKVVKTRARPISWPLGSRIMYTIISQPNFSKLKVNCRSVLSDHWKDQRVSIRAKRLLLQSISFQFPCAANFKKSGWQEEDECRLCISLHPEQSAFSER